MNESARGLALAAEALRRRLVTPAEVAEVLAAWAEGPAPGRSLGAMLARRAGIDAAQLERLAGAEGVEGGAAVPPTMVDLAWGRAAGTGPDATGDGSGGGAETLAGDPAVVVAASSASGPPVDPRATTVLGASAGAAGAVVEGGPLEAIAAMPPGVLRFRPERFHARGGIGEVYVAWDEELARPVALKELRPDRAGDVRLRARFVREAEVNANLEHPGVVPVYGQGRYADGRPYYAMRFVEGETLQQALERFHAREKAAAGAAGDGWVSGLRALVRRFVVVCETIAYAHARGVLHRDLKPANILLGTYGETVIIDWGLAKVLGRGDDPAAPDAGELDSVAVLPVEGGSLPTMAGETLGSPAYMSPEQADGRHDELTPASDVYGLGATLYAVLTGHPPVRGRKVKEVLAQARRGAIAPVRQANPRVPRALAAVCEKAMRREAAERYASARALADDLERWLADEPVSAAPDPLATRALRWARHHKPAVAAAVALASATVVALAVGLVLVGAQRDVAVRAEAEATKARDQAYVARDRARRTLGVGMEMVEALVDLADRRVIEQLPADARETLLRRAAEFNGAFLAITPEDPSVQAKGASVARRLGNLARLRGDAAAALARLDEATRALEARPPALRAQPTERRLEAETAIDRGDALMSLGRREAAREAFAGALERLGPRELDATAGDPPGRVRARALQRIGLASLSLGRPGAGDELAAAVEAIRPVADASLDDVAVASRGGNVLPLADQVLLVEALAARAGALEDAGRAADAGPLHRAGAERMEQVAARLGPEASPDVRYFGARQDVGLAAWLVAHGSEGDRREADARLAAALAQLGELAPPGSAAPPHVATTRGEALLARAELARARGDVDAARRDLEEARAVVSAARVAHPDQPELADLLAEVQARLAALAKEGR